MVTFQHTHNLYEIFHGLNGSVVCHCEDQAVTLGPDDAILIGKGNSHYIEFEPQKSATYLAFIFDIVPKTEPASVTAEMEFGNIIEALAHIDKQRYAYGHCSRSQSFLLEDIEQELHQHQIGWSGLVGLLFYRLFMNVLREFAPNKSGVDVPAGYKNIALLASKYIHANYAEKLTIDMVADALHVTPRHVNRLFNELFGTSFAYTVNVIRTEYARPYLLTTDESIERIASRVGLPSGKVLTKLFKERYGMTPSEYRAMNKKTH
ncbi:MAG: AraC family transcriptional regulator [Butyricicoccus sp.]|nr:AraC family transcriptional regulator [Butyricicoccus sp.]